MSCPGQLVAPLLIHNTASYRSQAQVSGRQVNLPTSIRVDEPTLSLAVIPNLWPQVVTAIPQALHHFFGMILMSLKIRTLKVAPNAFVERTLNTITCWNCTQIKILLTESGPNSSSTGYIRRLFYHNQAVDELIASGKEHHDNILANVKNIFANMAFKEQIK